MNYMAGRTILDGSAQGRKTRGLERPISTFYYERLLVRSDRPAVEIVRRVHGKSANNSLGDTERAFANFTIFSKATFRSPRSTPPM